MTLPLPGGDGKGPLAGYFLAPNIGAYFSSIQWEYIEEHLSPQSEIPNLVRRDAEHEVLQPWDEADLARLGINQRASLEQLEIETLKSARRGSVGDHAKVNPDILCLREAAAKI